MRREFEQPARVINYERFGIKQKLDIVTSIGASYVVFVTGYNEVDL